MESMTLEGDQLQPSNPAEDEQVQDRPTEAECFTCEHCQRSFTRKEHLKRHSASHTPLRQFSCLICSRDFRRRDSLKRHMATHGHHAAQSFAASSPGVKRTTRACLSCVRSKQRCVGGMPCERCRHKRARCIYPTSTPATIGRSSISDWASSDNRSTPTPGQAQKAEKTMHDDTNATSTGGSDTLTSDNQTMNAEYTTVDLLGESRNGSHINHARASSDNVDVPPLPQMSFSSELDTFSGLLFHPFAPWPEDDFASPFGIAAYDDIPVSTEPDGLQMSHTSSIHPTHMPDMRPHVPTLGPQSSGTESNTGPQFPALRQEDMDTVIAEKFGHVKQIPEAAYQEIKRFYQEVKATSAGLGVDDFPPLELLGSFLELYFEHFNPMIPIIHSGTFEPSSETWILLLAMMTVGGQYSTICAREQYVTALQALLQRAILAKITNKILVNGDLSSAQSVFLLQMCLQFNGSKRGLIYMQYQRGWLLAMLRPILARHGSIFRGTEIPTENNDQWLNWIRRESWHRLVYFAWYIECVGFILFDLPPNLDVTELHQSLPCKESLWGCLNATEWQEQMSKTKESPSLRQLLGKQALIRETLPDLGDAAHLIVLLSLYVEESRVLQLTNSWIYLQGAHGLDNREHPECECIHERSLWSTPQRQETMLDRYFEYFRLKTQSPSEHPLLQDIISKTYHLVSLLRLVPLKTLRIFSSWMTTPEKVERARKELEKWIEGGYCARKALLHAAALFQSIRDQRTAIHSDPWYMMAASLCIWTHSKLSKREAASTDHPLRIDKPSDTATLQLWLTGSQTMRVHITGIGILDEADSASRTLQQTIKILRREGSWGQIGRHFAAVFQQVLDGSTPSPPV